MRIFVQLFFDLGEFLNNNFLKVVLLLDDFVAAEQVLIADDFLLMEDHFVLEDDFHLIAVEHL